MTHHYLTNPFATPNEREHTMTGYGRTTPEQWDRDDLARAEAAGDYAAINAARKAGHLDGILTPPADESDPARIADALEPPTPVGPTVPDAQPGGTSTSGPSQMTQTELDSLAAAGDFTAINEARRTGRMRNLGA